MRKKRTKRGQGPGQQPEGRPEQRPEAPAGNETRTEGELAESLSGIFSDDLLEKALANPTNKRYARQIVAAGALRHYLEVMSRAYGGDKVSEGHAKQIPAAAKLYAIAVGNLREREVAVYADKVLALLVDLGEEASGKPAAKLIRDIRDQIPEKATSGRPN